MKSRWSIWLSVYKERDRRNLLHLPTETDSLSFTFHLRVRLRTVDLTNTTTTAFSRIAKFLFFYGGEDGEEGIFSFLRGTEGPAELVGESEILAVWGKMRGELVRVGGVEEGGQTYNCK